MDQNNLGLTLKSALAAVLLTWSLAACARSEWTRSLTTEQSSRIDSETPSEREARKLTESQLFKRDMEICVAEGDPAQAERVKGGANYDALASNARSNAVAKCLRLRGWTSMGIGP